MLWDIETFVVGYLEHRSTVCCSNEANHQWSLQVWSAQAGCSQETQEDCVLSPSGCSQYWGVNNCRLCLWIPVLRTRLQEQGTLDRIRAHLRAQILQVLQKVLHVQGLCCDHYRKFSV